MALHEADLKHRRKASSRLSQLPELLGYSAGNFGKSLVWTSFDSFLLYYLVTFGHFSLLWAGSLLAVLLVWDGCADLLVSFHTDRQQSRDSLGRLLRWGAPLCGVNFAIIFTALVRENQPVLVCAVVLARVGYTLCDIGHNTLLVRVADTPWRANSVSGMRLVFSALGSGSVGLASAHILEIQKLEDQSWAFGVGATLGGLAYFLSLTAARLATRDRSCWQYSDGPRVASTTNQASLYQSLKALFRSRPFRFTLLIIFIQAGVVPFFNRSLPFLGEALLGQASWGGTALATITLGQFVSLPVWMMAGRWLMPRKMLITAHLIAVWALGAIWLTITQTPNFAPLLLLFGVAQSGMNMAIWAILPLCLNEQMRSSAGSEALPVGVFLAVLKCASGFGTLLLSGLMYFQNNAAEPGLFAISIISAAPVIPMMGCAIAVLSSRKLHRVT